MPTTAVADYLKKIEKAHKAGNATEHTHRPALKALLESIDDSITATNEPKRIACGSPDFQITRKTVPLGHVETKDVGVDLDEMEQGKGPTYDDTRHYQRIVVALHETIRVMAEIDGLISASGGFPID
jgi:hypothetical protein